MRKVFILDVYTGKQNKSLCALHYVGSSRADSTSFVELQAIRNSKVNDKVLSNYREPDKNLAALQAVTVNKVDGTNITLQEMVTTLMDYMQ